MKSGSISMLSLCFLSLGLIVQAVHESDGLPNVEVADQREFDYSTRSSRGPDHWGSINSTWSECNRGHLQSPINIRSEAVTIIPCKGDFLINYKPCPATLRNRGHDIMVKWLGDAGSVQINNTDYRLLQSHWHSPSEHHIDGKKFALEQHLVHRAVNPITNKTKVAVLAILYNIGPSDTFLSECEQHINIITNGEDEIHEVMLDPTKIKAKSNEYYRYTGSLTTPDCAEGVTWTIDKEVRTVTRKQVKLLRAAIRDVSKQNTRPIQPTDGRNVLLYVLN